MTLNANLFIAIAISLAIGVLAGWGIWGSRSHGNPGMHRMPDGSVMANDGSMGAMMHDMNAGLEGKTGDAFDRAFLDEMIVHHEGAVDMAKKVLEVSKRPELLKLAGEIISAQEQEINQMKAWREAWFK